MPKIKMSEIEVKLIKKENGVAEFEVKEDAFVNEAKDNGFDKKTLQKYYNLEKKYIEAVTEKGVREVEKVMEKDPEIKEAYIHAPFRIEDKLDVNVVREVKLDEDTVEPRVYIKTEVSSFTLNKERVEEINARLKAKLLGE